MGDCSGQPPPFFSPLFFHLFSLVYRFMIVLQKNVEKKSVPIRPCTLGNFKLLQLWSNLKSFTGVFKVTFRGYTPMYDISFFTIFWACCNGDGPSAGFCHPTPTPPATYLILTIKFTPMYDKSFFIIFWARHNDSPTADFHHPTLQQPNTSNFLPPCMIHHFSWFFEPDTMMMVPQLISTTPPPPHLPPT